MFNFLSFLMSLLHSIPFRHAIHFLAHFLACINYTLENTSNTTFKYVRVTIFPPVEKTVSVTYSECVCVCVCVCILSYPTYKAHAPYYHVWPAPLCNIFPHYLINGSIFGKKLLNTKCVFWFSVQRLSETFLILRRTERDMIKNVYRSASKVPVIVVRL